MQQTASTLICLLLFLVSCQQRRDSSQPLQPIDIVKKSIAYHDSANRLKDNPLVFKVKHYGGSGALFGESLMEIDQKKGYIYELASLQSDSSLTIERYMLGDSSWAKLNGSSDFSKEDAKKHYLDEAGVLYMTNYYRYIFSLPHNLIQDGAALSDSLYRKEFKGIDCYWVSPKYDDSIQRERWTYFFDPESFKLIGGLFCYKSPEKDGNYSIFEGEKEIDGMKFPEIHDWKDYNTDKSIGKDEVVEVKKK